MLYSLVSFSLAQNFEWKTGEIPLLSKEQCEERYSDCVCADTGYCAPPYEGAISPISPALQAKMENKTWREGCPIAIADLSVVQTMHWTPEGTVMWGYIIIASVEAENVKNIFGELYQAKFPITSMKLMHEFDGSDDASMAVNNTSGFNCRQVKNTNRWSHHSYGQAIDVNPLWNPWVRGSVIDPPTAKEFVDRNNPQPGLIRAGDSTVNIFAKYGWKWGGYWSNGRKDYQHFSTSGK